MLKVIEITYFLLVFISRTQNTGCESGTKLSKNVNSTLTVGVCSNVAAIEMAGKKVTKIGLDKIFHLPLCE